MPRGPKEPVSPQGDDFAATQPHELHPMADIRLVIIEVSKLSTLVERLVTDVADMDKKVDKLRHQATYLKACFAAAALALAALAWFVNTALSAFHK